MAKRVGRFQLAAKSCSDRREAFKRVDQIANTRPSSSGAGRKLTKKQRINAGFDKESAIDPRTLRYGLPALVGTLLGSAGGVKGSALGAMLGLGAGYYLTPENRAAIAKYFGGGAGSGVGSSAEPPVPPPSLMDAIKRLIAPSTATRRQMTEATKTIGGELSARGGGLISQLIGDGLSPEEAYRQAEQIVVRNATAGGIKVPQFSGANVRALEESRKDPSGWLRARVRQSSKEYNPSFGASMTALGDPAGSIRSLVNSVREGDATGALVPGGFGTLGAIAIKKLGLGKALYNFLPATMLMNAGGTVYDAAGAGAAAPVDPSLPFSKRLSRRANLGTRAVGETHAGYIFGPKGRGTAGQLGSLLMNPVGNIAAMRSTRESATEALARARMSTATAGAMHGDDPTSQALRRRLKHISRATGTDSSAPFARVLGGYGSYDPRDIWAAMKNTGSWYKRRLGKLF